MKFREHRGSLKESMSTVVTLTDRKQLAQYVGSLIWNTSLEPWDLTITFQGEDRRIGWQSHMVSVARYGVVGYTDSPV